MCKTVPSTYALLNPKEKICYTRLATAIKLEMDKMEVPNQVRTIMMDYERELTDAFKATYENVQFACCDFHWKSCIWKRIAADGLQLL
jgi:hypothetical protein